MRRTSPALIAFLLLCASVSAQNISTLAGGSDIYKNVLTVTTNLPNPQFVVVDSTGNFYVTISGDHRVWKVDTSGIQTVFAGQITCGSTGDGGPATSALLCNPFGMAFDSAGNLFIADLSNSRIRKVNISTGTITTLIGNGCGFVDGPASTARLCSPRAIAFDGAGNLFIADSSNRRVRKWDASANTVSTVVGNGTSCNYNTGTNPIPCGDGGPATSAAFSSLIGVTVDSGGNLFVLDSFGAVRKVDASTGIINAFAGTATNVCSPFVSSGPATTVPLCNPFAVTIDSASNLFIADTNWGRIRKVDPNGNLTTLNFTSTSPNGIAFDSAGQLFVAYSGGNRVWKVNVSTSVGTIVGGDGFISFAGDGGPATSARMNNVQGVAQDASGNTYISDTNNARIRRVDTSGTITTLKNISTVRVVVDNSGNLLSASGCQILRINPSTLVTTTVAGTGSCTFGGDGGLATSAFLWSPQGMAVDSVGNIFIADTNNHRIRKVDASTGIITTVAGIGPISVPCGVNGTQTCFVGSFSGDGGPATQAGLSSPYGVAVDASGNILIADSNNQRVRRVDATTGIITTVVGNGSCSSAGDGLFGTSASLCGPRGIFLDSGSNLFIADSSNSRVRRVDGQSGIISTVAGGGSLGDGNPATSASVPGPWAVFVNSGGNLLISQASSALNARVRQVFVGSGSPTISLSATSFTFADQNVNTTSAAQTLTITNNGTAWLWTGNIVSSSTEFTRTNNCPVSIAPGANCTVTFTFRPTTFGLRTGTLTINDNAPGAPHLVPLSGNGLGATIGVSPTSLSFGNQVFNTTSAPQTVTVTNNGGNISLNISSVSISTHYIQTNNCVGASLAVGASCSINVSFKPLNVGPINGSVSVSSNAFSGTSSVSLTGFGQSTTSTSISAPTITYPANATVTVTINAQNVCSIGGPAGTIDLVVDGGAPITQPTNAVNSCTTNSVFTLTGLTAGSHTLSATYNSNNAVYLGSSRTGTQTVNKANQTITFPALSPMNFGDPPPALSATASSGLAVSYSIVSGPATVAGNMLTITGVGTVTVKASQPGDSNWNAATSVNQAFTVSKGNQTITFPPLSNIVFGDPPPALEATASYGLALVYSIVSGPATVSGDVLTITGAGTVTVRASQPGDSNWNAAASANQSFVVAKADQKITFGAALGDKTFGDAPFAVSASATSGLAVSFSIASGPATILGNIVTITGAGAVVVRASQGGDSNYNAAADVDQTFTVEQAATSTSLASSVNPSLPGQSVTFTASVSSAAGAPTGSVQFFDGTTLLGSVPLTGNSAAFSTSTLAAATTHNITAVFSGDANFHGSTSAVVSQTVIDNVPPDVTVPANMTVEATSSAGAAVTFSASANDNMDGLLTPTCTPASGSTFALGTTTVTCSATDAAGNHGSAQFSVTVSDTTSPVIAAHPGVTLPATSATGATVNYAAPATSDAVDGAGVASCLPASGSTFALGTTTVTCHATDAAGNPATATTFTVTVLDATPPTVNCGSADGVWHASDVSIACTAADSGSGLANAADASFTLSTSAAGGTESSNTATGSRSVCDNAGNCTLAGPIGGNMVDKKAPAITISAPANNAVYILNQAATSGFSCADLGSGAGTCTGTVANGAALNTASVGTKSFTVAATDAVGNTSTLTYTYTVTYASGGMCNGNSGHSILQPVNVDGSSVFKQGSTVPAKFRACDANGNSIGAAGVIASFNLVQTMSGTVVATVNEPVDSTTPDANFRWDSTAMQWIFNINTKPLVKNVTYFYRVTLNDGTTINFNFGLK